MTDANARRWQEMSGSENAGTATYQPPPAAQAQPQTFQPPMEDKKAKKQRKEKAPKAPKAPSASRTRVAGGDIGLLDMGRESRSRDQLMQEGAEELMAALGNSYGLLHAEVPDSSSPDDAQRKIQGQLGQYQNDPDSLIPNHPIYDGDTLVYFQLRRHYGLVQPGNSQGRPGGLLRRSESVYRNFTAANERGNLPR